MFWLWADRVYHLCAVLTFCGGIPLLLLRIGRGVDAVNKLVSVTETLEKLVIAWPKLEQLLTLSPTLHKLVATLMPDDGSPTIAQRLSAIEGQLLSREVITQMVNVVGAFPLALEEIKQLRAKLDELQGRVETIENGVRQVLIPENRKQTAKLERIETAVTTDDHHDGA